MAFKIMDGSRDDRQPLAALTAALQGKIFADTGYLSKLLLERLWQRGLHLVTWSPAAPQKEELSAAPAGQGAVPQTIQHRDPL
ncbi:MAG: hypothetical protein F4162_08280 [Synechococcus sp. SB0676_bin_10]|uniref:Transposase DDE domain-containing protein n=1 Tax=Synechococcus sp. SB0676_bin_10 TaxID=2604869 RepID=A0A6B1F9A1_9SYNE|nr:hypothetical protein [Synechococcus sp. SB0676_bin_10]MYK07246.1 hypothetical protein [Synechococcus sp. SB0670_bin_20]